MTVGIGSVMGRDVTDRSTDRHEGWNSYVNLQQISKTVSINRNSVAGSVIQASEPVELEDGLKTAVLPGGCWYALGNCT